MIFYCNNWIHLEVICSHSIHFTLTQIAFNVVASVKFNEKLRDAVEINVLGTKKILDLVMGIKNLKVCIMSFVCHIRMQ